jgi:galactose mutarotase-like enzyme
MFTIENQQLKVTIHPKGAELQSIFHKGLDLEYMWGGDPAFWGKHSPILFPIVGSLKEDTYYFQDKAYTMSRHGFAREMEFEVTERGPGYITFLLRSNEATLKKYPFAFELRVTYLLTPDGLKTTWSVKNLSAGDMYFSIGGHPAFKVPLVSGTNYNDYFLELEHPETLRRWPISPDGLIEKNPVVLSENDKILPLTKELFAADALVFKNLSSKLITLKSAQTDHGLQFNLTGFPYLGIWAAKNADFVCIEPWCGIADSVDTDQQLVNKEGINRIAPGTGFKRTWSMSVF